MKVRKILFCPASAGCAVVHVSEIIDGRGGAESWHNCTNVRQSCRASDVTHSATRPLPTSSTWLDASRGIRNFPLIGRIRNENSRGEGERHFNISLQRKLKCIF